ncbi:MAG: hypothetical protein Q9224_000208 [Gallowayella concinna]
MDTVVGILGGGQLGRMLTEAANRLNIKTVTLDAANAPAKQINSTTVHVNGSFMDRDAVLQLAKMCDVITVEIEHVNTNVLEELSNHITSEEKTTRQRVQPHWHTIRIIQDKYHQKKHLQARKIPTAAFESLQEHCSCEDLEKIGEQLGYPYMLKSRTEAYDGRGNYPIKSPPDIPAALAALRDRPLYAEEWANFRTELAVMVVKTENKADQHWQESTVAYPVVETIHEDSICKLVYAPARDVPESVLNQAQESARRAVAAFEGKGVFGVEMFRLQDGK